MFAVFDEVDPLGERFVETGPRLLRLDPDAVSQPRTE
jgi:hypothetical protein